METRYRDRPYSDPQTDFNPERPYVQTIIRAIMNQSRIKVPIIDDTWILESIYGFEIHVIQNVVMNRLNVRYSNAPALIFAHPIFPALQGGANNTGVSLSESFIHVGPRTLPLTHGKSGVAHSWPHGDFSLSSQDNDGVAKYGTFLVTTGGDKHNDLGYTFRDTG